MQPRREIGVMVEAPTVGTGGMLGGTEEIPGATGIITVIETGIGIAAAGTGAIGTVVGTATAAGTTAAGGDNI